MKMATGLLMMKSILNASLLTALLCFGLATTAKADPLTIRGSLDYVLGESIQFKLGSNAYDSTTAGLLMFIRPQDDLGTPAVNEAGTYPLDPSPDGNFFYSFCMDITEDVWYDDPFEWVVEEDLANGRDSAGYDVIGPVIAANLAKLFGAVFPDFSASITSVEAAALQILVWEMIYETPGDAFDVSSGNMQFTASSSVIDQANSYLATFANYQGAPANGLKALNADGLQDQLIQVPTSPDTEEVPEPGTFVLMGLGLAAVSFFRRRTA